ncbi:MAG: ABC transporter ATP-binding protein [Candidatus Cloacimonetes bacterium]|nr:ABC transporter ATP-binding protein [Candidatus Cloacimonadota bacterium]
METKTVIITRMSKAFPTGEGDFLALKSIDLEFGEGEFAGIVGPSGSGKTTLLNVIGSLDAPTSGEVEVLDHKVSQLSQKQSSELRSRHLGFIFQTYNLLPVYNVYENVEFPLLLLKLDGQTRDKMVKEALEWVGLTDKMHSRPAQLSGGQCQRVAIARAMVKKPTLVLADEPTANLDTQNSLHILDTMKNINASLKTSFIFATHDDKVIKYMRRVIRLIDGEVVSDDLQTGV